MTPNSFASLPLPKSLIHNLETLEYHEMTPIQAKSLPLVLQGRDIIAKAKTGSGKTAAFGLGILAQINPKWFAPQALIMCPTRELADQVANELRRLARGIPNIKILSLCGGVPLAPQRDSLAHGAHIIVGTPGRLQDHIGKGTLDLENIRTLVLDEADRMLEMGFADTMAQIISYTPEQRQTLLFSATFPDQIKEMSAGYQDKPEQVSVDALHETSQIEQSFYQIPDDEQYAALRQLLMSYQSESTLIFCNTRHECKVLANELTLDGFSALSLHGELDQRERDETLLRFANKSCAILVATDVASRGIDIKSLETVINFGLTPDPEVHIHRIGRTGRAGSSGRAISLFSIKQTNRLIAIEEYQRAPAPLSELRDVKVTREAPLSPEMVTISLDVGKKNKIRPGDILGALTKDLGFSGDQIGKINITANLSYIAVKRAIANQVVNGLRDSKIKGRSCKVRRLK